jgi:hypothetical protein
LGVVTISYDSVDILADFAKRKNITFPMLSDPNSTVIRSFGVLNTAVPAGHVWAGVPYPGTFIVGRDGVVKSKYFEEKYQDRYTAPTILLREAGSASGTREKVVSTAHLTLKYSSTRDVVRPNLRFTLVSEFEMKPKMHVYAPEAKGYIPIKLDVDASSNYSAKPAAYPKSELLYLAPIKETIQVFQGKFRVTQDVVMAGGDILQPLLNANGEVKITGRLRYQACDDQVCYLPQNIPMEWTLKVEPLDRERVPEPIQHKAKPDAGQ